MEFNIKIFYIQLSNIKGEKGERHKRQKFKMFKDVSG